MNLIDTSEDYAKGRSSKFAVEKKPTPISAFASDLTLTTLRVTILKTIDIVEHLLRNVGFIYVLTGMLNQDCIEVN